MITLMTVGLGPHGQVVHGVVAAKLKERLTRTLRKIVEEAEPSELPWFELRHGTSLERVHMELASSEGKRLSGLVPLVVEPRTFGPYRKHPIVYHPAHPKRWLAVADGGLAERARAHFAKAFRTLPADELADLFSDGKDALKMLSFSSSHRTLRAETEKDKDLFDDLRPGPKRKKPGGPKVLHDLTVDLTASLLDGEPDLGLPRTAELEQLAALVAGDRPRSVVIVGPDGAGKSTLLRQWVRELALSEDWASHQKAERLTHVHSTSAKRLIAGMSHVGDWEARCLDLLHDLRTRKILHVADLHRFGRIGKARDADRSLADFFKGPVARGEVVVVGDLTPEQHALLVEEAPAFAASFVVVPLPSASRELAFRAALHTARGLELQHRVAFSPHALRTVVELGSALLPTHAQPGQAVDLTRDLAGLLAPSPEAEPRDISPRDVEARIATQTGLPDALVRPDATVDVDAVKRALDDRVLGQPRATAVLADLVLRIKAGLADPSRPLGVLLFTGPTGTGKTELAKALAEHLFGSVSRLVRFDMGELTGPDAALRLAGSPWEPDGALTRAVIEQPMCVLLFDEIEKADRSVHDLFLQVFEDARLTDRAGNTASFAHTVIILTSNLGARGTAAPGFLGTTREAALADVHKAVREFFAPELLNRIDEIVPFSPLDAATAEGVAERALGRVLSRRGLADRNVFVRGSRAVARALAKEAFSSRDGARSLTKRIDDVVGTRLAEILAERPSAVLRMVWMLVERDGFTFRDEPLVEREEVPARSYLADALGEEDTPALAARLPAAREEIERLRDLAATRKGLAAEEIRARLAELDLALSAVLDEDDDEDRYDTFETGRGDTYTSRRVRLAAPRALVTPTKDRMVSWLVELARLDRLLGSVPDAPAGTSASHGPGLDDETSLLVEWMPITAPDTSGRARRASPLLSWLVEAHAGALSVEDAAVLQGGVVTRITPGELVDAARAPVAAVCAVLSGLAPRDLLTGEEGTHVWLPTAAAMEIVRVRLVGRGSPVAHLEALGAALAVFEAAAEGERVDDVAASNPAALTPLVRKLRCEAPRGDGRAMPVEIEDHPMALAEVRMVESPSKAVAALVARFASRVLA